LLSLCHRFSAENLIHFYLDYGFENRHGSNFKSWPYAEGARRVLNGSKLSFRFVISPPETHLGFA
jgi:hypothetical protein